MGMPTAGPAELMRAAASLNTKVAAAVQKLGSVKDEDVIAAADRLGLAMVLTGTRQFRH